VKKMSDFQAGYVLVAFFSLILSIVFFFIDGMLLYAIGFFVLFLILGLMKVMWGVSVWTDNTTRRMSGDQK
jgi:hypothetical protein